MNKPRRLSSNVKWFSAKQMPGRRARRSPCQIASLRLRDLAILFRARYGITLPDDDAGRDDLDVALNHIAGLAHPRGRMLKWIEIWAPWLTAGEQRDRAARALANQQHWKADQLAWRLGLTREERTLLGITTIGATDHAKRERTKRRQQRDRNRKAAERRAKGAISRPEYVAQSINHAKPWKAKGISRRTWYRRHKPRGTSPATP